jgi:hypothetical protein
VVAGDHSELDGAEQVHVSAPGARQEHDRCDEVGGDGSAELVIVDLMDIVVEIPLVVVTETTAELAPAQETPNLGHHVILLDIS